MFPYAYCDSLSMDSKVSKYHLPKVERVSAPNEIYFNFNIYRCCGYRFKNTAICLLEK